MYFITGILTATVIPDNVRRADKDCRRWKDYKNRSYELRLKWRIVARNGRYKARIVCNLSSAGGTFMY